MIPKVIHYCWFGHNKKSDFVKKCIESWSNVCPEYEIIEWNENNFSIESSPLYVRQAYESKKWAFVSDYVRLKVIYDHGGIYLDTDVQLIRPLDSLLCNEAFFGFENNSYVATGLGFGSVPKHPVLGEMLGEYNTISFKNSENIYDLTPCPVRNTKILKKYGLLTTGITQLINSDILVLAPEYLCPVSYDTGKIKITDNTISIHWYSGSWLTDEEHKKHEDAQRIRRRNEQVDYIIHIPNRIFRHLLGDKNYAALKRKAKKIKPNNRY